MTLQKVKQKLKKVYIIYEPYIRFVQLRSAKKRRKYMMLHGEELLRIVVDALNQTQICWFAAFGTLLGFVRENDFISWDLDIDIGILKNDDFSWKILENLMNESGLKKVKQFTFDGEITEQTYSYNGATVDFFRYAVSGESMTANIYCRQKGKAYPSDFEFSVMKSKVPLLSGITQTKIKGTNVNIPLNYKEYLSEIYGENWMIPEPDFSHESREQVEEGKYAYAQFFSLRKGK